MAENHLIITSKRPKGEDGCKVISVRAKEETVDRIDKVSSLTGRSRNELIGIFLDYALEHCKVAETEEK